MATAPPDRVFDIAHSFESCHANRDPHRTLFGRDCQGCHTTAAWTVGRFRDSSRDCVQCHQAPLSYYMMHFEMMDRTISGQELVRVEQCFLCHQTNAWNIIRGVGWYKAPLRPRPPRKADAAPA